MKTTAPAKAASKTTKPATAKAKAPHDEPKSKTKAKTTPKKAKAPVKPKAKKPTATRPFLAGVVLKAHGIKDGVTPEMVADLNKRYGVKNDRESGAQLKWAIQVLRGYVAK